MQINFNILFFGATAAAAGIKHLERSAVSGLNVGGLLNEIKNEHPKLSGHKLLTSINQNYADADEIINDGDEIAIFTPVSGG